MYNPVSTYRLQFHKDFTFSHFESILLYLQKLGVKTVYASPIFYSTPGSVHGYDGLNPHRIDPEIGTQQQLLELSKRLQEAGMGWLQDIVPNHMAFDPSNPWLKDVLEKGQRSVYASFFDVPWTDKIYHGKIMLPFLGSPLKDVIANKELQVVFEEPRFMLKYYDAAYPVRLRSYADILAAADGDGGQAVQQLVEQIQEAKKNEDPVAYKEPLHEIQLQLTALFKNDATKDYLQRCVDAVNNNTELLEKIAGEQVYQLCHWQKADQKINFRRFFTINGLICLNMQNKEVFEHYHKYILYLLNEGVFNGLRVDHIDGLYDPTQYLQHLRELAGDETYIVVEKILEPLESLPDYWNIEGNTGYDFLSIVNNVFTLKSSKEKFTTFYQQLVNDDTSIHQQIHDKKSLILHEYMGGELTNLHNLFVDLNLADDEALTEVEPALLKDAIAEFLIQCPVYRYYGNSMPLNETEAAAVQDIFNRIRKSKQELSPAVALLEPALLQKPQQGNDEYNNSACRFYQRCMQFTGPLMAKGVEDTLMYTYNRFIGHNEVGDSPEAFGYTPDEFHQMMIERQQKWHLSMNATSTHDTKRGEDVRARLNVLSDLGDEWLDLVKTWNSDGTNRNDAPDANDKYLLYQTIIGAYPMPGEDEDDFSNRIQEYVQKALREAKTHSNWTTPNEEYENAAKAFAVQLLNREAGFWESFEPFHKKVADFGIINSLAQVALKFTCPGVPDLYQGTELWDLSLVDPDNRRPVDYEKRQTLLKELETMQNGDPQQLLSHLWQTRYSGAIKQWLVQLLLHERKQSPELFTDGEYLPLTIEGAYKENVLAFARKHSNTMYVVIVPLHLACICKDQNQITEIDWNDTHVLLPDGSPFNLQHLFTNEHYTAEGKLYLKDVCRYLPMAVLKQSSNA